MFYKNHTFLRKYAILKPIAISLSFFQRAFRLFNKLLLNSRFMTCGKNVNISPKSRIYWPEKIEIGDNVFIEDGLHISCFAGLKIVGNFMAGANLTIIGGDHDFSLNKSTPMIKSHDSTCEKVIIEDDVWCGANVTILKGVTISKGCVIGAGTVITKSTKEYGIYVGVPGKLIKFRK